MKIWSLIVLILYLVFSGFDCFWAEKRASLRSGASKPDRKKESLYTRRFRLTKFFLMPLVLAFYLVSCRTGLFWPAANASFPRSPEWLIILALLFGWGGDVLLELSSSFFIYGLLSFLLGHVFYIIRFFSLVGAKLSSFGSLSLLLGLLITAVSIFYVFYMIREVLRTPQTKGMRVPLSAYLLILCLLIISSGLYFSLSRTPASICSFLGACLFVLSDTLLAFSMFKGRSERGIMLTYTLAQLLLVLGALI